MALLGGRSAARGACVGRRPRRLTRVSAAGPTPPADEAALVAALEAGEVAAPRDDDVLPDSLLGAVTAAAYETGRAVKSGVGRSLVELFVPELWDPISGNLMADAGDQQRVWELTREFNEQLVDNVGGSGVLAVYPDAGCAALLKNRWADASFGFASLNDRSVLRAWPEDGPELRAVCICCPDPPGLDATRTLAEQCAERMVPLVMINPRLASGDAGIGTTVRRMRTEFLGSFNVTYSLRQIGDGSVFKAFNQPWKVFVADEEAAEAGRYKLVSSTQVRPQGEDLENIVISAMRPVGEDGELIENTPMQNFTRTVSGLQRFMRSLSN